MIIISILSSAAFAQNFPSAWSSAGCTGAADFCDVVPFGLLDQIICDFSGEAYPVTVYAVTDYGTLGHPNFSVFGYYGSGGGSSFACFANDPSNQIVLVEIVGSDYDDFIDLQWSSSIYLDRPGTSGVFYSSVYGEDGEDEIWGSPATHPGDGAGYCDEGYCESFEGGEDDDIIRGRAGREILTGNDGHDDINGNEGDDTIYGRLGDDVLRGGDGNDYVDGGDGEDVVKGGAGDDELYGGDDCDTLCGAEGTDYFDGGACADVYWSPSTANPSGVSTTGDTCGSILHGSGWAGSACTYSVIVEPADCSL